MTTIWRRYSRLIRRAVPRLAVPLMAVGAAMLFAVHLGAGAVATGTVTVVGYLVQRRSADDRLLGTRAVTTTALMLVITSVRPGWPQILSGAAMLMAVLADALFRTLCPVRIQALGLKGYRKRSLGGQVGPFFAVSGVWSLWVVAVLLVGNLPTWTVPVITVVLLGVGSAMAVTEIVNDRRHVDENAVALALTDYSPSFVLYFCGSVEGLYQVRMWLPYLKRVGQPFVTIVRNPALLPEVHELTGGPVVAVRRIEVLERVLPASVGAMFYVNNDVKNADGVRMNGPTHVHLGHGDSEKPPSYAPTTAMFDKIFVAGQAGIDRFARHGVAVPASKFVIVGRPQLESMAVSSPTSRTHGAQPVVLYAPTWRGGLNDMQFGSLAMGEAIVRALVELGARVIFRPHPFSARDAESRLLIARIDALMNEAGAHHITSAKAGEMSITDCFNASDAAVTDVSSVASDYLFSGKPLAVVAPYGDDRSLNLADYPFLAGCYVLTRSGDPRPALTSMLSVDPLRQARLHQREYYLGDTPAEGYANTFVAACRQAIAEPSPRSLAP